MQQVIYRSKAFAESERPILLLGETGTGKTLLAKLIHEHRKICLKSETSPFVSLNINALSMDLIERELFGSEKGAFTDSKSLKIGFFELANGGTLFLDEIGDASIGLQVKLLKVLDEHSFYRLGGEKEINSQFKLICATHRNLEEMVRAGRFREDLYMRISTFQIMIPPLCERKEDVPEIIKVALPRWCAENRVSVEFQDLPEDFLIYVSETPIPGNIRGIEHIMSRLLVLSEKDEFRKPRLEDWRECLGIQKKPPQEKQSLAKSKSLSLKELMELPLDVVENDFPGLSVVMESILERIFLDAQRKYKTNNAIAKALRMSPGNVSIRLKNIRTKYSLREHEAQLRSDEVFQD